MSEVGPSKRVAIDVTRLRGRGRGNNADDTSSATEVMATKRGLSC